MSLTRAFSTGDLSVRSDQRTIVGIAVPWNRPTTVSDDGRTAYTESFDRGAFARTIAERGDRVKLLAVHDRRSLPVGRAALLREDAAGLYAELRVSNTRAGDEVLELVRDGSLDGLSIGFRGITHETPAPRTVVRTEVRLDEISVVPFPAYEDARIHAVRAVLTPNLATARRRLELARAAAATYMENR
jgi:hypothetical protein